MRRRQFITLLSGAAASWPLAVRAQQAAMPVVGILSSGTLPPDLFAAFRRGLKETGYVEGQNVALEHRAAHGDYTRFRPLAEELVRQQASVIFVPGGTRAALAAKAVTSEIPIVFYTSGDPVTQGLVTSLNRPGGNITGMSYLSVALDAKRLELLDELVPSAHQIGMLVNPNNTDTPDEISYIKEAANTVGRQITVLEAGSEREMDVAFAALLRWNAQALVVGADAFFTNQRVRLVALAARDRIPAIYDRRDFAVAGGLISYGHERVDAYRQLGTYCGRILKGAKPSDLPVVQPTRFELVINLKTATALGLDIPPTLLARAEELIE
jgi:ABC-type uncharacterized transport system substrate-binding protein